MKQRRILIAAEILLALLKHRRLDYVVTPDTPMPADARIVAVSWRGHTAILTIEAPAFAEDVDEVEVLWRAQKEKGSMSQKCPACKTDRSVVAETAIPRLEEGMRVCIDCGCVFVELTPYRREVLKDAYVKTRDAGPIVK